MRKKLLAWMAAFICGTGLFLMPAAAQAAKKIDIETLPVRELFKINELKPGDWMTKTLAIKNTGENDYNYYVVSKYDGGSRKLYDQLTLVVKRDNEAIYKGKLKDFNRLAPKELKIGKTDSLSFTVTMPYELGNEYQALDVKALLVIRAEMVMGQGQTTTGTPKDDQPFHYQGLLPQTGESLPADLYIWGSIFLLAGGALVFTAMKMKSRGEK